MPICIRSQCLAKSPLHGMVLQSVTPQFAMLFKQDISRYALRRAKLQEAITSTPPPASSSNAFNMPRVTATNGIQPVLRVVKTMQSLQNPDVISRRAGMRRHREATRQTALPEMREIAASASVQILN